MASMESERDASVLFSITAAQRVVGNLTDPDRTARIGPATYLDVNAVGIELERVSEAMDREAGGRFSVAAEQLRDAATVMGERFGVEGRVALKSAAQSVDELATFVNMKLDVLEVGDAIRTLEDRTGLPTEADLANADRRLQRLAGELRDGAVPKTMVAIGRAARECLNQCIEAGARECVLDPSRAYLVAGVGELPATPGRARTEWVARAVGVERERVRRNVSTLEATPEWCGKALAAIEPRSQRLESGRAL